MYSHVIIHGTKGNQYENWIPWLFQKLTDLNFNVLVPQFLTPEGQDFENWSRILDSYLEFIDENTIIVAHSIGAVFALKYFNSRQKQFKNLISVSGFREAQLIQEYDELNKTFFVEKEKCNLRDLISEKTISFLSENDPYLDLKILHEFANLLNAKIISVPKGGHFNLDSGYDKFKQLFDAVI